jgi:hypothetical protein
MKKLKELLKKHGMAKLTVMLGYRSQNTISIWLRNNEISPRGLIALQKIK